MRRGDRRVAKVAAVVTALLAGSCAAEVAPAAPVALRERPNPEGWRRFPLVLINVQPHQVAEVAPIVDVVSYYTSFAPFEAIDGATPEEAAHASLRFEVAEAMIEAAEDAGVHATITTPFVASTKALVDADPIYRGDGIVVEDPLDETLHLFVDPGVVPGCSAGATEDACIEVPTSLAHVDPDYVEYWASKLPPFLSSVTGADPTDRMWGIYGIEEIRHWGPEYGAQHRLRDAMDAHPGSADRPLVAYQPHNRMPGSLAWTLLRTPASSAGPPLATVHAPAVPRSFSTVWNDPDCDTVGPGCQALALTDYYPLAQSFARGPTGALLPLQTHIMRGNYQGLVMGDQSHRSRIGSFHRVDVERQTIEGVEDAYTANGQHPPRHLAFHMPDLNLCSLEEAQTTPAEARHDFWSGVHRGQGIFIYNYAFVAQARSGGFTTSCQGAPYPTPEHLLSIWTEYAIGLRLIKQQLRPYLVDGVKTEPLPFDAVAASELTVIPGTDYLVDHPIDRAQTTMAMPDYPALQGSSYRLGDTVILIVTSAFDQTVRWTASFDAPVCSVSVLHGPFGTATFAGSAVSDAIDGIDGRVYRVELAGEGGCD